MDRGDLGTFLFTAAVLLGFNGLRISEPSGTNIEDLGFQRGHRNHIIGKGNKPALIPLVCTSSSPSSLAADRIHRARSSRSGIARALWPRGSPGYPVPQCLCRPRGNRDDAGEDWD
jgi:hypothetical protein